MCRKLLEELRTCNEQIDREPPDTEKVAILWDACVRTRIALKRLMMRVLEGKKSLDPEVREALEQFLVELPAETSPLRSQDGKSDPHGT